MDVKCPETGAGKDSNGKQQNTDIGRILPGSCNDSLTDYTRHLPVPTLPFHSTQLSAWPDLVFVNLFLPPA